MNFIDLVIVDYGNNCGTEICYTPRGAVDVGDTVLTQFGEGKVTETLFTYSEDDVYKFFKRNMKIRQVLSKLITIKYDPEDENGVADPTNNFA